MSNIIGKKRLLFSFTLVFSLLCFIILVQKSVYYGHQEHENQKNNSSDKYSKKDSNRSFRRLVLEEESENHGTSSTTEIARTLRETQQNITIPSFEIVIVTTKPSENTSTLSSNGIQKNEFLSFMEKQVTVIIEEELLPNNNNDRMIKLSLFYDSPTTRRELLQQKAQLSRDDNERLSIIKAKDTIQTSYIFNGYIAMNSTFPFLSPVVSMNDILSNAFHDSNKLQIIKTELHHVYDIDNILSISFQTLKTTREHNIDTMQKVIIDSQSVMLFTIAVLLGSGVFFAFTSILYNKLQSNAQKQDNNSIQGNGNSKGIFETSTTTKSNDCDLTVSSKRSSKLLDVESISGTISSNDHYDYSVRNSVSSISDDDIFYISDDNGNANMDNNLSSFMLTTSIIIRNDEKDRNHPEEEEYNNRHDMVTKL